MVKKITRKDLLRDIPSVDEVLSLDDVKNTLQEYPRELVVDGIRIALENIRKEILDLPEKEIEKHRLPSDEISQKVVRWVKKVADYHLKPVINATGVVLHTNLGRAPLPEEAIKRINEISRGYSNLEYDLERGERGSRYSHVQALIKKICGAEAAFVVNNNAAAVLLALNTLAAGTEVIVSRGEMIEIGGSFRIPEIMKISGAELVEVGTTNKTHLTDYREAITENTGLLLKVHPSNYRVVGFSEDVSLKELVKLGEEKNIPVVYDAGSGALVDFTARGFPEEPSVNHALKSGVNIVTFSGDKLLGGPQAGIIVGREKEVNLMKKNHLNRALRIDKLTLAALEATLRLYLEKEPWEKITALKLLSTNQEGLLKRAESLAKRIGDEFGDKIRTSCIKSTAQSGGGALPDVSIPSAGIKLEAEGMNCNTIEEALRHTEPPVIALIKDDAVFFDMRTIFKDDEKGIIKALQQIGL